MLLKQYGHNGYGRWWIKSLSKKKLQSLSVMQDQEIPTQKEKKRVFKIIQ